MTAQGLLSASAVRERCANICNAVSADKSAWFTINRAALPEAAALVAQVSKQRYPNGQVPYHSRWRHFEAGGVDRAAILRERLALSFGEPSAVETARAQIDLTVVSVLLDAGAGARWSFDESASGQSFERSEGLGVASFNAFIKGAFSSRPDDPCRVDGHALQKLDANALAHVFQAHEDNPLIGLEQRAQLLNRLGETMLREPARFGPDGRPGEIFIRLTDKGRRKQISAADLLHNLLVGLSDVWMTGSTLHGLALGDTWQHPLAGGDGPTAGWVPFHKLSQWLAYSLLEPFEWAGVQILGVDELTALPEYRNGGLLIDTGVIQARDNALLTQPLTPADEPIIEWRALTVHLIDELAAQLRESLGQDATQLPLARILEGGTWAAGRQLAAERRDGAPPLNIVTDGTVF